MKHATEDTAKTIYYSPGVFFNALILLVVCS